MSALYGHDKIKTLAKGIDHSEGICVGLHGEIFLGSESGKIYRISTEGKLEVVAQSPSQGILLGLSVRKNGHLLVCDAAARTIWDVDIEKGEWKVFCDSVKNVKLNLPNWGCFLADGSYIFSDSGDWKMGNGKLVRVDTKGIASIWSDKFPNFPNGIALSSDQKSLFVLESTPGKLIEIQINPDSTSGSAEVLWEMNAVPDGVTVTTDGTLVISCYRPDSIYLWNKKNGNQVLVEDIEGTYVAAPTNTVLTGPDRNLLVWPNFGRWDVASLQTQLIGVPVLVF